MVLNYVRIYTRYDIKLLTITDSINRKLISFHYDTQSFPFVPVITFKLLGNLEQYS